MAVDKLQALNNITPAKHTEMNGMVTYVHQIRHDRKIELSIESSTFHNAIQLLEIVQEYVTEL